MTDTVITTVGWRAPVACAAAGITYRQLDYWARTGLVEPSIRDANGSGSQRLYSLRDIVLIAVTKRLLDCGISLTNVRAAIAELRDRELDYLTGLASMPAEAAPEPRLRVV